jgi:hypothetical protein
MPSKAGKGGKHGGLQSATNTRTVAPCPQMGYYTGNTALDKKVPEYPLK